MIHQRVTWTASTLSNSFNIYLREFSTFGAHTVVILGVSALQLKNTYIHTDIRTYQAGRTGTWMDGFLCVHLNASFYSLYVLFVSHQHVQFYKKAGETN